jgi:hypothetical protein
MDKTTINRMDALSKLIKSDLGKEGKMNTATAITPPIKRNRCQCKRCGDIIESIYRHDWVECGCRAIFTDGGKDYLHRGFTYDADDIIDMTEYWSETLDNEAV